MVRPSCSAPFPVKRALSQAVHPVSGASTPSTWQRKWVDWVSGKLLGDHKSADFSYPLPSHQAPELVEELSGTSEGERRDHSHMPTIADASTKAALLWLQKETPFLSGRSGAVGLSTWGQERSNGGKRRRFPREFEKDQG